MRISTEILQIFDYTDTHTHMHAYIHILNIDWKQEQATQRESEDRERESEREYIKEIIKKHNDKCNRNQNMYYMRSINQMIHLLVNNNNNKNKKIQMN